MAKKPNLSVTLIEGSFETDIDQKKLKGKMDPFVELVLGAQKYETKVAVNQGRAPKWNETFNFVFDETVKRLEFLAFDKEGKGQKQPLGTGVCDLMELLNSPDWTIDVQINLNSVKQGVIKTKFDFIGKQPPAQRPVPQPKQQAPAEEQKKSGDGKQQSSGKQSSQSSYKSIENKKNNSSEPATMKKLEPLPPVKIEFRSVAYEDQAKDLEERMAMVQKNCESVKSVGWAFEQVSRALGEALEELRRQRPEDQVKFFGEFLASYGE